MIIMPTLCAWKNWRLIKIQPRVLHVYELLPSHGRRSGVRFSSARKVFRHLSEADTTFRDAFHSFRFLIRYKFSTIVSFSFQQLVNIHFAWCADTAATSRNATMQRATWNFRLLVNPCTLHCSKSRTPFRITINSLFKIVKRSPTELTIGNDLNSYSQSSADASW